MKSLIESCNHLLHTGRAVGMATVVLAVAGCSTTTKPKRSGDPAAAAEAQLLFVQSAGDLVVDTTKSTLRLVNVNQQTLYFSDRPVRIAGHMTMPKYMDEWTASAGPDNFSNNPPNAVLSVYESGAEESTLAVVEIFDPVIDGKDLIYHYKLIEGPMPKSGGSTALFIDSLGVGGGVGVGRRGVGVGRPGVGVR